MTNDVAKLIYDFPLLQNKVQIISRESFEKIYMINGFHYYSEFIYPVNMDVEILHRILNYDPELASKYSSLILQDIINNNEKEVAALTEHFLKRVGLYSIPLAFLILRAVSLGGVTIAKFKGVI